VICTLCSHSLGVTYLIAKGLRAALLGHKKNEGEKDKIVLW
jgi:hypothetical protein